MFIYDRNNTSGYIKFNNTASIGQSATDEDFVIGGCSYGSTKNIAGKKSVNIDDKVIVAPAYNSQNWKQYGSLGMDAVRLIPDTNYTSYLSTKLNYVYNLLGDLH
jgi:hypothetical protein